MPTHENKLKDHDGKLHWVCNYQFARLIVLEPPSWDFICCVCENHWCTDEKYRGKLNQLFNPPVPETDNE